MQIKAGFKKEWFQFSRTFRLWGILIATVSFSLADPLMYWAMNALLGSLTDTDMYGAIGGAVDIENSLGMLFGSAGSVFAGTMADLCATSLLIIMLILMSPCGGEQKKRATIIPSCSGLDTFSYLIPKYVMYPGTVFVTGFLAALISGGLCNLLFTDGKVSGGMVLLAAFLCYVFCCAISVCAVVWVLLSEMYPIRVRGVAMSIAGFSLWTGTYLVGQLTPWMLANLTPAGTFFLFAAMCVPYMLLIWKAVPEMSGRTLEEIERYWTR